MQHEIGWKVIYTFQPFSAVDIFVKNEE